MPGKFGPRFALEALFLVAAAFIAWLLDLSIAAVVAVMFVAWLLVALVEWQAARSRARDEEPAQQPPPPASVPAEEPPHVRVFPREPDPAAQPVLERASSEPEIVVEPPAPAPEPVPPAVEAEAATLPEDVEPVTAEPEEPEPAELAPVPEPPPATEPEPEPEVVPLPVARAPREWNLWDLERIAREHPPADPVRAEEQAYLLVYLREFARPDGRLPLDFDRLVRESFGDLLEAARA